MAVSVVSFSFSRAAQSEAQGPFCWVMAFFIASYQHLLWTTTRPSPTVSNFPSNSTSVLTSLYNSSTPTRSLKSNV